MGTTGRWLRCLGLVLAGFAALQGCGTSRVRFGTASGVAGTPTLDATASVPSELATRLAELQARLQEREKELSEARAEIERLRSSLPEVRQEPQSVGAAGAGLADAGTTRDRTAEELAAELSRERNERLAVVRELERLRQEVGSPFGENRVPEADYLALKQELLDLRRQLQQQEEEQRRLAARIAVIPSADSRGGSSPGPDEHTRLTSEAARELAASRQRIAELEAAVESLREQGSKVATLVAENDSLRSQLAEERRRAEALEAKLKVAARVTDLIFRMRSQNQGELSPRPPREPRD